MPSVKNPNGPSMNRLAAKLGRARKQSAKAFQRKVTKVPAGEGRRGAREGLLPTSGPNKPLSAKRQRKLEPKMGYALQRKMAAEDEVVMKDAAEDKTTKKEEKPTSDEAMVIDEDKIPRTQLPKQHNKRKQN